MSHSGKSSGTPETKIVGKLSKKATENKSFIVEMNNSTREESKINWSRLADEDDDIPEGITSKADNVAQGNSSKIDNAALHGILNKPIGKKKLENLAAKGIKQHKINPTPNLTSARNKEETGSKKNLPYLGHKVAKKVPRKLI